MLPMGYGYPEEAMRDFIEDYEDMWGVILPFGDALLMMSLYDGLSALLEKYDGDVGDDGWPVSAPARLARR